jgi:hypothetical protein
MTSDNECCSFFTVTFTPVDGGLPLDGMPA